MSFIVMDESFLVFNKSNPERHLKRIQLRPI